MLKDKFTVSHRGKSRTYKKDSCHRTKRAATGVQNSLHESGKTAQVKKGKDEDGKVVYCVFTSGSRKKGKYRHSGQTIGRKKTAARRGKTRKRR